MNTITQIAQNNGRFYRVALRQFRYFPIKKQTAIAMLASGEAIEVAYLPFGRADLMQAHSAALKAIEQAAA